MLWLMSSRRLNNASRTRLSKALAPSRGRLLHFAEFADRQILDPLDRPTDPLVEATHAHEAPVRPTPVVETGQPRPKHQLPAAVIEMHRAIAEYRDVFGKRK